MLMWRGALARGAEVSHDGPRNDRDSQVPQYSGAPLSDNVILVAAVRCTSMTTQPGSAPFPFAHRHVRHRLLAMPIPQPERELGWHCWCGAVEFDTYPPGPDGVDASAGPIGLAWVEPWQLDAEQSFP
jgi:hypothetical protein